MAQIIPISAYPRDPDGGAAGLDRCLTGIAAHDPQALEALYQQTHAAIYAFALSILKNTHDAEDVLQECYLKIYASAGGYCPEGKPMAWILTIARNLCIQHLRARQRTADLPQEDWEPYLDGCESLSQEDRLVIRECMSRLSDQERQIVTLHAVAGFRHREIAALLGLPLATVLSKYSRAIRKLKQYL